MNQKSEKTRDIITRIAVPALLGAALIAVCIWGAERAALAEQYKTTTENVYARAYTSLGDDLNDMEAVLSKLSVTTSPSQYVLLLDDLWRLSGSAAGLMSQLPSSHVDTADINRFVIQVGDYARALSKKAVRGTPLTGEDTGQISALHDTAVSMAAELNGRIESGDLPLAVITAEGYYASAAGEADTQNDESVSSLPTLIYDGPYSDSAEKMEPKGLSGPEVTADEALAAAQGFAPEGVSLSPDGECAGRLPCYDFSGVTADGREISVAITKTGGRLLYLMSSSASGKEGVPEDPSEAERYRAAAVEYLARIGFPDMKATYAEYYAGTALINCAATQNGVILYNDLVKVWIERDTLAIVGVDARNYHFSHVERELAAPGMTLEEAEGYVSTALTIKSRATALIPLTPETECLCYEFRGTSGSEEFIVYINASTGEEEEIFKIINSEDGQLVI